MTTTEGKKLEGSFSGDIQILDESWTSEPNVSGNISVDGAVRDADYGEISDYGVWGENTHYNYDFDIYDMSGTYELYFEAFSLGTGGFQAGTFNYAAPGSSYFNTIRYSDYGTSTNFWAVGGSVVVTKLSGTYEYRLVFDVLLDDESELTGTVEGNFDYYNFGGREGGKSAHHSKGIQTKRQKEHNRFRVNKSSLRRIKK